MMEQIGFALAPSVQTICSVCLLCLLCIVAPQLRKRVLEYVESTITVALIFILSAVVIGRQMASFAACVLA